MWKIVERERNGYSLPHNKPSTRVVAIHSPTVFTCEMTEEGVKALAEKWNSEHDSPVVDYLSKTNLMRFEATWVGR